MAPLSTHRYNPLHLLLLITIFGAIARIWFFWRDGLHVDEKFTLDLVQHPLSYVIQYAMTSDCNPPLFYVFDWFSVSLLGVNAFAERLPSVIFGILIIPAVYYLGKEIRSETLGLLSALSVSTLGSMWYYSGFGRAYMLECLLFVVFCIYWIQLARGDNHKLSWLMVVGTAALLAYTHLFSVVPLALMFAYLLYQKRLKALWWALVTGILASPLLLLFNAILRERAVSRDLAAVSWNWYGATVPQLIVFAPLEFFGYNFVFWIPMIVYATWTYRKMRELVVIIVTWLVSFGALLALANSTPVFIRYVLLFVPVAVTIGLLPVADFIDGDATKAQKIFVVGAFGAFYFAILAFSFMSGLYMPKGNLTI